MTLRFVKEISDLSGKVVIWRADFNVAVKSGKISDEYKLVRHLPTLFFLLSKGAKVVIISHLGRPGGADSGLTLKPVAERLSVIIDKKIAFLPKPDLKAETAVNKMRSGGILMLENIRFEAGEEADDRKLAKKLAGLGDYYVNDAFAVSHRAHASVHAICKYIPSYAGLLLQKEVDNLGRVHDPQEPMVLVLGGAKIKTKLPLIRRFHKKAYKILIGGALANNFFKAGKHEIGRSKYDEESLRLVRKLAYDKIIVPVDVVVGDRPEGGLARVRPISKVGPDDYIFDIGPQTIKLFSSYINKARTLVWNGPLGFFEARDFSYGTLSIATLIAARSRGRAFGVVGGGETVAALKRTKMLEYVDWVSTGGGAMLAFLGGARMPGLEGLKK